jgi:hypothetical protein
MGGREVGEALDFLLLALLMLIAAPVVLGGLIALGFLWFNHSILAGLAFAVGLLATCGLISAIRSRR